ncbi:hypothetical protein [Pseudogemmobacter bohemicus]|uniref:hypothetical protein n=1 Tax=Pseudogemmobacter bohemicus TaxID=2250708 RepID=UPI0013002299|nr:hypothetical protein [Pseudogemmobacter bohemicus]
MREIYDAADALVSRGAHRIRLFDSLKEGCGLDFPLNDPDTGDTLRVAELSVEDSGFGPAMWRLALALIQERAGAQPRSSTVSAAANWEKDWELNPGELSMGTVDVIFERERQYHLEGWTAAHDDAHSEGELAGAAAAYSVYRSQYATDTVMGDQMAKLIWPWRQDWWKPTTRRRDLVKAAALLIAEIDRLDRLELDAAKGGGE